MIGETNSNKSEKNAPAMTANGGRTRDGVGVVEMIRTGTMTFRKTRLPVTHETGCTASGKSSRERLNARFKVQGTQFRVQG
jgi:hypothetical protein